MLFWLNLLSNVDPASRKTPPSETPNCCTPRILVRISRKAYAIREVKLNEVEKAVVLLRSPAAVDVVDGGTPVNAD